MRRYQLLGAVAAALTLTGCPNNNQVILPGPGSTPPSQVLYVSAFTGPDSFAKFILPLTASSTPTVVSPTGLAGSTDAAFDASGNLFAVDDRSGGPVLVYARPITSASSPIATITLSGASAPVYFALDSSGNLWVADANLSTVKKYLGPFSGSSTPAASVVLTAAQGLNSPSGLAFDGAGNLYVANSGTSKVLIFTSPISSGQSPTGTP